MISNTQRAKEATTIKKLVQDLGFAFDDTISVDIDSDTSTTYTVVAEEGYIIVHIPADEKEQAKMVFDSHDNESDEQTFVTDYPLNTESFVQFEKYAA